MYLLALFLAPLVAAGLVFFASGKDGSATHRLGIILSLIIAVFAVPLVTTLPGLTTMPGGSFSAPWFTMWGTGAVINFSLASDGLSGWLIQLAAWLTPVAILAAGKQMDKGMRQFVAAILIAEAFIIGALLARDLVVFYLCYEAMLVPMLVVIALFGGEDRRSAALWFFIYTMAGSVFMLAGIWYIAAALGTTDLAQVISGLMAPPTDHAAAMLDGKAKFWLFVGFVLAFAVKVPLPPLHAWQARTYAEAPGAAVVILGGVMSKLGIYGFLRFVLPMFPVESAQYAMVFVVLGLIAVVGGALVAIAQDDAKRMLAYSSFSHLGMVMIGVFSFDPAALAGVPVQMVAHGLSAAALFVLVGAIEARTGSYGLEDVRGLANQAPLFAVLFTGAALASAALPGTMNFAGEFALLLGTFRGLGVTITLIAGLAVILGAVYILILLQKWLYGKARGEAKPVTDLGPAEALPVAGLLAVSVVFGFWPTPVAATAGPVCQQLASPAAAARATMPSCRVLETAAASTPAAPTAE
jgi:NADH-quinone oxidoreductase subunit M